MERHALGWASIVVLAACLLAASGGVATSAPAAGIPANDTLTLEANGGDVTVGQNATIEFELSAAERVNGSAVVVDLPESFAVVDSHDDGGIFNDEESTWFWLSQSAGETVAPTLTVAVPDEPGTYEIGVNASDAEGHNASTRSTVTVSGEPAQEPNATLALAAEGETVAPGQNATLDFELDASAEVYGPAIVLALPDGFEVLERADDGGTFNPAETTWFWLSQAPDETYAPSLTVAVPDGVGNYSIEATASHSGDTTTTANATVVVAEDSGRDGTDAGGAGGGYGLPPAADDPAGNGTGPPTNETGGNDSGPPESAAVDVSTVGGETQIEVENAQAGESITIEPGTSGSAVDLTSLELDVETGGSFELTTSTTERDRVDEDVDVLPGERSAIEYFTLAHEFSDAQIDGATVEFRVDADSLADGADANEVRLERYADGEWQPLETTVVEEGVEHVTYAATTHGFSTFAVSAPATPAQVTVTTAAVDADEVTAGTTVEVTATVENVGGTAVDRTVNVTADDETLTTERVSLEPGERRDVTFTWTASETGSHEIRVGGELAGVLQVTDEASSSSNSSEALPGFTLWLAVLAIVAAVGGRLSLMRRH